MEKAERIVIRCSKETQVEFKKIAAELGTYEDVVKRFIEVYQEHPNLFGRPRRRVELL